MAASSFSFGITPASLFFVAFTTTMTFINNSLSVGRCQRQ
jgi:hypothetical protein